MAKDKLPILLRLAKDEEQARGADLATLRGLRTDAEATAASLEDMLGQYRDDRSEFEVSDSRRLANFQRFYGAVRETLGNHSMHVDRLRADEQQGERAWQTAYRKHQAIRRLTDSRKAQQQKEATRKERRAGVFRRWTMLNRQDQEQDV